MNIFDRHRMALEKNKQLNKAMKKRAYEKYLEASKKRSKEYYIESKLFILRSDYSGIHRNGNA